MSRNIRLFIGVLAVLCAGASSQAFGEEEHIPSRAAWIEPAEGTASWVDLRSVTVNAEQPAVVSTGRNMALARLADGGLYAIDAHAQVLGRVVLPENTSWYVVDEQDRILAYDGKQLWTAASWEKAADVSGYQGILDIENVRKIDAGGNTLAYADETGLSIVDLETGTVKKVALADFFNAEKVAAMTPEAVQTAENAKNSKKKSKSGANKSAQEQEAVQVADIQGIWWRADGTGLIRVRSLMNVRTFVTADNGRSWRQMEDAPDEITHSFGWIWNGTDRVLSRDASSWVTVCGARFNAADRFTMGHQSQESAELPEDWLSMAPVDVPAAVEQGEGEENSTPACAAVAGIPVAEAEMTSEIGIRQEGLYGPELEETGLKMGLYRQGGDSAWMIAPESNAIHALVLPTNCRARYVGSVRGLGMAMCDAENDEVIVYTRTVDSEWAMEVRLPAVYSENPALMVSQDGTIVVSGACFDETMEVPIEPTEDELAQGIIPTATQSVTRHLCPAAVRLPENPGMENVWRVEQVENANSYVPLDAGRFLSIESDEGAAQRSRMTLRTPMQTQILVDEFDPEPYEGVVMTREGCLALYDGTVSEQELRESASTVDPETGVSTGASNVRLMSTQGRIAELDCASSRAIAEMGVEQGGQVEVEYGDDRYGLRVGGGGFFSTGDVKTWMVRVEALFPIYNGQYEVAVMYRMAGGNSGSALGHIGLAAIRWRYDGFELFDFAVGAGIGFGSLCGYRKPASKGETGEDAESETSSTNEKESGYKTCNDLSMRYLISGIATYKLAEHWKIFIGAELIGGSSWGFDLSGGIEYRF